jgi:hypothetical protein
MYSLPGGSPNMRFFFEVLVLSAGWIFLEIMAIVIGAVFLWIYFMKENLQKLFSRIDEIFTPPWKKGN